MLLPGLVDLQVNGAAGHSIDSATPDELDQVAACVRRGGASGFLPTLITAPIEHLCAQLSKLADWIESGPSPEGATPLGIHLEGPFLELPGAHDPRHLLDPTPELLDALIAAARGHLRLVTLAPARSGAPEATRRLVEQGVAVSIGHAASTRGLRECVEHGASLATHLFNAMSPLHHRKDSVACDALSEERLACSLIVDGVHVKADMLTLALLRLGAQRAILVSDSSAPAGMPDGAYELAGMTVIQKDGVVRNEDSTLAGSALSMGEAAANLCRFVGAKRPAELRFPSELVAATASTNPCRILGEDGLGAIAPGKRARFARLLHDEWEQAIQVAALPIPTRS